MAMARTRRGSGRRAARGGVVGVLQWLWAGVLSLLLIAAGLALTGTGLVFVVAGAQAVLEPDDVVYTIAGVLFALVGAAGVVGGVLVVRWQPRAVEKLSGRTPPGVLRWLAVAALSLVYYATSGMLVVFGAACVWNGIGPGSAPALDYPVAGVVMLVSGIAVFVFFPRLVKRLTGRAVLSSPYGAYGAGGGDGGGGGGC